MFERFTSPVRRVMVLANKEARDRGHHNINGAHFALGLLEVDRQAGTGLFDRLGLAASELRPALEVEAEQASGGLGRDERGDPPGNPPFTPTAKKALETSLREALKLNQNWIGPGHLLLGLVSSAASTILVERLELDRARDIVAAWEGDQPASDQTGDAEREQGETISKGFSELMKAAMTKADKPVGSHHLLRAMFEVENTVARKVLEALGATEQQVAELIERIGTAGSIDAPPAKQAEIRVSGRKMTVEADVLRSALTQAAERDPALAQRLRHVLDGDESEEEEAD